MLKRFPERIWLFLAAPPLAAALVAFWIVLCKYVPAWQIAAGIAAVMFAVFSLAVIVVGYWAIRSRIRRP